MGIFNSISDKNVFDANGSTCESKITAFNEKWTDGITPSELIQKAFDALSTIDNISLDGKDQ